ncbi:GntR family transcriptional regulator [Nocardioides cavernaquae]|uniref:GntR family transcriptional regulator n=1 Tax=Nocardioides cavernaquae TaxID=2321396 RepID=A0A3A5HBL1_9ACTN|nr:GntR family transcriptional regulator [Nocardioides cavernaquae]RJS47491.1 GntR family transcriptional regulator [Nocardioides cavernaquae]
MTGTTTPSPRRRERSPAPRRRSAFAAQLVNSAPSGVAPRVLDDLRRAILSGQEPPGTLIPIDAVAEFFGVSHIPVREALKMLTSEGLVEHVPHIGYSVAKLTFAEFRELYEVREALEAAALRAAVLNASTEDDDVVRASHAALTVAAATKDASAYHEESRRFHMALIAPAGMQRLAHMYEAAWNMTEAVRPMARVAEDDRLMLCSEHDHLLDAFLARDGDRLAAESAQHFEHLKLALQAFASEPEVFRPGHISFP